VEEEETILLPLHPEVVVAGTFQEEVASVPLHLHKALLLQIEVEEVAAFPKGEEEEEAENQKKEEEDTFQEEDQEVVSPLQQQQLDVQLLLFP